MKNILIVDDSENQVLRLKNYLLEFNCNIDVADSYASAIKLIKKNTYDLFIIDIIIRGNKLGTELVGRGADSNKTIIISGQGETLNEQHVNDLIQLYKIPNEHILHKPISKKLFTDIVNIIFNNDNSNDNKEEIKKENIEENKENKEILPVEKIKIQDIVNVTKISEILDQLTIYQWLKIFVILFLFFSFIGAFCVHYGYIQHEKFEYKLDNFCNKKFAEFSLSDKITNCTYIEKNIVYDKGRIDIKIYPQSFVKVVVFRDNLNPEIRWLYGDEYIKETGLDQSMVEKMNRIIEQFFFHER